MSHGRYRHARHKRYAERFLLPKLVKEVQMASFRDIYKKPLLSAKNLGKRVINAKILECYPETMTDKNNNSKDTLIIELDDNETRISLNKGNAVELAKSFGDDYTEWVGRRVKVTTHKTEYMGKSCDGLLVTAIKGK